MVSSGGRTTSQSDANARGTFNFTGLETGYDFSDFLLGLPYQTSVVTYLNNNDARYLRETAVNAFATDDYRVLSNLTINGGLRWEYFAPYTEKNGQMANLDVAPGFTAVAQVLPGQTGPYSGAFPQGFIKPDYKLFSPRIGIAWKPWKSKQIVVRSGYGIYYNGSVYGHARIEVGRATAVCRNHAALSERGESFVARKRFSRRAIRSDRQYIRGG